jgi:hypothetical protein
MSEIEKPTQQQSDHRRVEHVQREQVSPAPRRMLIDEISLAMRQLQQVPTPHSAVR